jgi:hypothetical protein
LFAFDSVNAGPPAPPAVEGGFRKEILANSPPFRTEVVAGFAGNPGFRIDR